MWITNAEPARHALHAELERVLGVEHADTLMTHLTQHTADKGDIALLADRFDCMENRMDDRFDRMEDRMAKMQRNFLAVSFGTLTVMTAVFALITRI